MYFLKRPRTSAASSHLHPDVKKRGLPRCGKLPHICPPTFPLSHFSAQVCKRCLWLPLELQKFEPNFLARDLWSCTPEAWKLSLMSVTTNTGWTLRPVEDVALQVISYSYSTVNNCFIVGNNAVYVDHRHSGNGKWVVQRGSQTEPHSRPCTPQKLALGWVKLKWNDFGII